MTAASPDVAALLAQVVQLLASQPSAAVPEPRPATSPDRVLLTVEEAAKRLRIGRTTAWGLVKSRALHSVQIGRLRRVPASAVDTYTTRLLAGSEQQTVRAPGSKSQTVADWLTHWLDNIAAPNIRYKTEEGYRTDIHKHLIPRIGAHTMAKIQHEPERFEKVYVDLTKQGYSQHTVHHVHITVRAAFREAKKRKVITENPFEIVKAPRVDEEEVEPFEVEEIQALLTAALKRRNGVRFVLALAIGTRKGETIGFRWSWLNKKTKVLRVRKQRQRQTYRHGCSDPVACTASRHKTKPCQQPCKAHKKRCPAPCPPGCTKHAMHCPQRIGGVLDVDVKSRAGRRGIRLPDQLFALLMEHEKVQAQERELAGDLWHESDFMFTQPNGKPIDPRSDHNEWKALLVEAEVRDARLHDARHTAATVLLLLGVPLPAVMEIMGWSNSKVAKRYSHVTSTIQNGIASQVTVTRCFGI